MAGSFQHVDHGWSMIENMGDAAECVEELLYLVYTNINKEELERSLKTFYEYKRGERNPEHDVDNPDEGHWDEAMAYIQTQDRMGR